MYHFDRSQSSKTSHGSQTHSCGISSLCDWELAISDCWACVSSEASCDYLAWYVLFTVFGVHLCFRLTRNNNQQQTINWQARIDTKSTHHLHWNQQMSCWHRTEHLRTNSRTRKRKMSTKSYEYSRRKSSGYSRLCGTESFWTRHILFVTRLQGCTKRVRWFRQNIVGLWPEHRFRTLRTTRLDSQHFWELDPWMMVDSLIVRLPNQSSMVNHWKREEWDCLDFEFCSRQSAFDERKRSWQENFRARQLLWKKLCWTRRRERYTIWFRVRVSTFSRLDLSTLIWISRRDLDFSTRSNTHTHTHTLEQIRSSSHDRSRWGATKFSFHSCACDSSETGMSGSISSSWGYHGCDE